MQMPRTLILAIFLVAGLMNLVRADEPKTASKPMDSAWKQSEPPKPVAVKDGLCLVIASPQNPEVGQAVSFGILIQNTSKDSVRDVRLFAHFDNDLVHETRANPLDLMLGSLTPMQIREVPLVLTPKRQGSMQLQISATGSGGVQQKKEVKVDVKEPGSVSPKLVAPPEGLTSKDAARRGKPSPQFQKARMEDRDTVIFRKASYYYEQVSTTYKSENAGKDGIPVISWQLVAWENDRAVAVKELRVIRADGRRVSSEKLWTLLRQEKHVLVSADGEDIDSLYLDMVKKDVLVFVVSQPKIFPLGGSIRPAFIEPQRATESESPPFASPGNR